jgi:hypothetical protein
MWTLLLIAVHMKNPNDIPGRINLQFQTQQQCEQVLQSMTYWLKFDNFKVEGKCQKTS